MGNIRRLLGYFLKMNPLSDDEYRKEHGEPHIHVFLGNINLGKIFINTLEVKGNIPKKVQRAVKYFISNNKQKLLEMWNRQNIKRIKK